LNSRYVLPAFVESDVPLGPWPGAELFGPKIEGEALNTLVLASAEIVVRSGKVPSPHRVKHLIGPGHPSIYEISRSLKVLQERGDLRPFVACKDARVAGAKSGWDKRRAREKAPKERVPSSPVAAIDLLIRADRQRRKRMRDPRWKISATYMARRIIGSAKAKAGGRVGLPCPEPGPNSTATG
jgi:hypothetical protein